MPLIVADRVRETTSTAGTGAVTLAGAVPGFRAFQAVAAVNDTIPYALVDGTAWEVGIGTLTALTTLARSTVLASSAGGGLINLSGGQTEVFLTAPAAQARLPDIQVFTTSGTWTKPALAQWSHIWVCGGGGGGGGGFGTVPTTVAAYGGSGGGAGGISELFIPTSHLAATEPVTVAAQAIGGTGGTDGAGTNGGAGGECSFGLRANGHHRFVTAKGGGPGLGANVSVFSGLGGTGGKGGRGNGSDGRQAGNPAYPALNRGTNGAPSGGSNGSCFLANDTFERNPGFHSAGPGVWAQPDLSNPADGAGHMGTPPPAARGATLVGVSMPAGTFLGGGGGQAGWSGYNRSGEAGGDGGFPGAGGAGGSGAGNGSGGAGGKGGLGCVVVVSW